MANCQCCFDRKCKDVLSNSESRSSFSVSRFQCTKIIIACLKQVILQLGHFERKPSLVPDCAVAARVQSSADALAKDASAFTTKKSRLQWDLGKFLHSMARSTGGILQESYVRITSPSQHFGDLNLKSYILILICLPRSGAPFPHHQKRSE